MSRNKRSGQRRSYVILALAAMAIISVAGLALVAASCSSRDIGRQKVKGPEVVAVVETTQFPGFTAKQRSDLQRILDDHKVMGMRVDGKTIFVSKGMLPQEKYLAIEREIRGIVGDGYEIVSITH